MRPFRFKKFSGSSVLAVLRKRASVRRRGAISLEAALMLPVLLILFGAVAQTMLLAQSRLYVEQAAYAAARSALVHKCPSFNLLAALKSPVAALGDFSCTDQPQKWEDAARWALVAAAPTSAFATSRGSCPKIVAGEQLVMGSGKVNGLDEAVANSICYAFEPGNLEVEVAWDQSLIGIVTGKTAVPIKATVRFKYSLSTPFRRFLYDGKRSDGTYWRWGEATVTLL